MTSAGQRGSRGAFSQGLSLLLLAFWGCSPNSAHETYLAMPDALAGPFTATFSTVHPGQLDEANRYLPAVSVNTPAKKSEGEDDCSGVLIAPRLILTAGHCVCMRRPFTASDAARVKSSLAKVLSSQSENLRVAVLKKLVGIAHTIVDGSSCADLATVTVIRYPPRADVGTDDDDADVNYAGQQYSGRRVRPHDELLLLYDKSGRAVFREADLAIIALSKPIKSVPLNVKLPGAAAKLGDRIVMVGYGYGRTEQGAKTYGNRHFGESVIVDLGQSDSTDVKLYARAEPSDGTVPTGLYGGDSGGPCFSKASDTELVGIAAGITSEDEREKLSVFTSIYPHREWLRKIADAEGTSVH